MIVSIAQPAYLPWLGLLDRIARSDLHVVLDTVQIDKSSRTKFANRNKVRTADGWTWLTVPIRTKGRSGDLVLRDIEILEEERWAERHLRTIRSSYARAPYLPDHAPFLDELYAHPWTRLAPLARATTGYLLEAFGIDTPLVSSSDLAASSTKDELLVDICREVGATVYVSGPFGRDYIRPELFEQAGIELRFHDYPHPVYDQAHPGFEPYMSALDLLLCHGEAGRDMLSTDQELAAR